MFPRRKQRERTKPYEGPERIPRYLQWLRGCRCVVDGFWPHICAGKSQAAHVRTGTDGAMGVKPSDRYALPLCEAAHNLQHDIGEKAFEKRFGISMLKIAEQHFNTWTRTTSAGQQYRREREQRERT